MYDAGSELNNTTGMYDLPYRNYDATLGRFFQVDALSHRDHTFTPYHYAGNNPIGSNDPSGLMRMLVDWQQIREWGRTNNLNPGLRTGDEWANDDFEAWAQEAMNGGGGSGYNPYGDASRVNAGTMSPEEYIAKYSAKSDYWLVYNEDENANGEREGNWSLYSDRSFWADEGPSMSSQGEALAFGAYKNGNGSEYWSEQQSSASDEGSWLNMFSIEGEISGGIQGGLNLNNMARANLNVASTPLFGFSVGRENKLDYLERHKDGLTIKQSASLGLAGFSGAWDRQFLGKSFGSEGLTDKYTVTVPIPLPFIFGVVNYFNETVVGPDGKTTNQGGLTIDFSGGVIINGSISFKYYGD